MYIYIYHNVSGPGSMGISLGAAVPATLLQRYVSCGKTMFFATKQAPATSP